MGAWPAIAAATNAAWCDLVCRTHDIDTQVDDAAWTSPTRTPPLYPDAITLDSDVGPLELLARIDSSRGCSIKDSFASLGLTRHGFRLLLDAQWLVRPPTTPDVTTVGPHWTVVRDIDAFTAWEHAWRHHNGQSGVLRAELLRDPAVTVLAARVKGHVLGGAILNCSTAVVGLSNFFADDEIASVSWRGCLALASALYPGTTLVGYETGNALETAAQHGFAPVGPLRVWLR